MENRNVPQQEAAGERQNKQAPVKLAGTYVCSWAVCLHLSNVQSHTVVEEEESVGLDGEEGSGGELHEEEGENDLVVLDPTHVSEFLVCTYLP